MQLNINTTSTSDVLVILAKYGLKIKAQPVRKSHFVVNSILHIPVSSLRKAEISEMVKEMEELKILLGGE